MEISNQKRARRIRQNFNITGIIIVLIGLFFLWKRQDLWVLITAGAFGIYVVLSLYANLCYVNFSNANNKITIKYYPIISLFKKPYELIEFPQNTLVGFKFEKMLGFTDLTIAIKTKRGIAEYPSISLSALTKDEIEQINTILDGIKKINK